MNSSQIAAALRILANAFEAPEGDTQPAVEPVKRGRGRPVKGEDQPATVAAVPSAGSSTAATAAAAAPPAGTQTTAPASAVDDPFETPPAAPAVPTATLDEVRASLKALAAATSQAIALDVLKACGMAANLTELKPGLYGAVVNAASNKAKEYAKAPEADPFEVPASAPAVKVTLEDVKAVAVAVGKTTSQDTVQKVVMKHGGKAALPSGGEGPSLKALPEAAYVAVIAELKALPATK